MKTVLRIVAVLVLLAAAAAGWAGYEAWTFLIESLSQPAQDRTMQSFSVIYLRTIMPVQGSRSRLQPSLTRRPMATRFR